MILSKVKNSKNAHTSYGPHKKRPFKLSMRFLNITQLLGALNDNLFKALCIYLLLDIKGSEHSTDILFWAAGIFVLPFLIFSTYGGILADRFSKQKLIISLKGLEVIVMSLGIWAFYIQSPTACYALIFLMAFQSALFGPSKYGIIPELVDEDKITKANGIISSSTYIAIIFGSNLGTAYSHYCNGFFVMGAILCTFIALIGFLTSWYVPKTVPIKNKRKMTTFVIMDTIRTLKYCKKRPYLTLAIIGSSFFLFLGAFIQLNLIPYTIESMDNEFLGGYLFAPCAVGIAFGSMVAGKTKRQGGNLALSCLASLLTAFFFFVLPLFAHSIASTVLTLICIGFSGGLFIVPLDTFIQSNSPPEKRGQVIATTNFLSFCGVLLAPICLKLFYDVSSLSTKTGFILIGIINIAVFIYLAKSLSGIFFNYASRKLICPFFQLKVNPKSFDLKEANGVVLHMRRLVHLMILMGFSTKMHIYIVRERPSLSDFFLRAFKNIHFIYAQNSFLIAMNIFKYVVDSTNRDKELPCLVIPNSIVSKYYGDDEYTRGFNLLRPTCEFITMYKSESFKRSAKKLYKLSQLSIAFEHKTPVSNHAPHSSLFQT